MSSLLDEAVVRLRQALEEHSGSARALLIDEALHLYHLALDQKQGASNGLGEATSDRPDLADPLVEGRLHAGPLLVEP